MERRKRAVTIDEMYQVDDSYKRFDQKYNVIIQSLWNEEIKKYSKKMAEELENKVIGKEKGYSEFDYAFLKGAEGYINKIGCGLNICDKEANSWSSCNRSPKLEGFEADEIKLTASIKKAAKVYGASQVGIASLDKRWFYSHWFSETRNDSFPLVFSDEEQALGSINRPFVDSNGKRIIPESMKHIIVMLFKIDFDFLKKSPLLLSYGNSMHLYAQMCTTSLMIAELIRSLGYNAIPSINCTALSIPLAVDAGLGQMGRHGKLINPELGSMLRISKVITDLPLVHDSPIDFGVTELCAACRKCARECPVEAISSGRINKKALDETVAPGYLKWEIDHKKCYEYWSECATDCSICVAVCSYNRGYKWTKTLMNNLDESSTMAETLLDSLEIDDNLRLLLNEEEDDFWTKL